MRKLYLGVVMACWACAGTPSPVHVVGTQSEIVALAGSWSGEYTSAETGRSGSIEFTLRAGSDTAFGDVVMVPRTLAPSPADARTAAANLPSAPQVLPITFVRIMANVVSGTLDPYRSPDCGCMLTTVFRGTIGRDRIDGTFTTAHSDRAVGTQDGRWWVTRKAITAR
jgi:hypothetical protein